MFGSYTLYDLFEIDASDIWSYERNRFYNSDQSDNKKQFIESIYLSIQVFFTRAKCEPVIKLRDIDSGKIQYDYYKNNFDRASNVKEGIACEMFIVLSDIYSLTTVCTVRKNEFNSHDFEKLFALKLRQYHDGLSFLEDFLNFQLGRNFEGTISDFTRFLNNILEQYEDLIDKKIKAKVTKWTEEATKIEFNSQIKDTPNQINDLSSPSEQAESGSAISDNIPSNLEENSIQTETLIPIPSDYKIVRGQFSLEDINHYFSFLYKEISEDGKPFLKEEDVKEIFKYGIAIPPKPITKKYKLNCGPKYPKNIIEYCIYKFFSKYTYHNKAKKDILTFFASYFSEFEAALENEKKFKNWSDNLTGKLPKRIGFDICSYLPPDSK